MPKEPQRQICLAGAVGNAVHIAWIATGEEQETTLKQPAKRNSGLAGARGRAKNRMPEDCKAIARKSAAARRG